MIRDWVVFSSSSGESLQALWARLSESERSQCRGLFCDRECGSADVGPKLLGPDRVFVYPKEDSFAGADTRGSQLEENFLRFGKGLLPSTLILLVGYFGILSDRFLSECPFVIVNTHPSLLPSFAGLDKRVHRAAHQSVCITGFTLHLVSEVLDGGTILFQHPVWIDSASSWEESRREVRRHEQRLLPLVWKKLLVSDLNKGDLGLSSQQVRARIGLNQAYFYQDPLENQKGTH